VNRVADGLGVELEPSWPDDARQPRHYSIRPSRGDLSHKGLRGRGHPSG
jgi:hypothetical protein